MPQAAPSFGNGLCRSATLSAALGRPNGPSFYMGTTQQTHAASSVMASVLTGSGSESASSMRDRSSRDSMPPTPTTLCAVL